MTVINPASRKYYAGVGSRETPPDILAFMTEAARKLKSVGYRLRSGGADGADTAFATGAEGDADIYLPWNNFNNRDGIVCGNDPMLHEIAAKYHPKWRKLSDTAKLLHARNVAQVLSRIPGKGKPSTFVVCWTPGGKGGGGTGQAIRIARGHGIRVYDLGDETDNVVFRGRLEDVS